MSNDQYEEAKAVYYKHLAEESSYHINHDEDSFNIGSREIKLITACFVVMTSFAIPGVIWGNNLYNKTQILERDFNKHIEKFAAQTEEISERLEEIQDAIGHQKAHLTQLEDIGSRRHIQIIKVQDELQKNKKLLKKFEMMFYRGEFDLSDQE